MKIKYSIILLPFVIVAVLFAVSLHQYVSAQAVGQGIEVSPPSQEVSVDPGKTISVKAKVRNPSSKELSIETRIEDFTAKGDQGQIELLANSPYSITSWTTVTPDKFTLAPGEQKEVTATVTVPSTSAGGRYGSFVFKVVPENVQEGATAVSQEIASLFLIKVSGPVTEKVTLKEINTPAFSEFGPVPMELKFQNEGNVHVKTYGLVNVTDMFGNKVSDIVVSGTNVFPGAERVVTAELKNTFLFGRYTATALMYYGSQNQDVSATTTFIVFPVRIAVIILAALVGIYLMRKRLKKAFRALTK